MTDAPSPAQAPLDRAAGDPAADAAEGDVALTAAGATLHEGLVVHSDDGLVVAANAAAARLLGLQGMRLEGKRPADLYGALTDEDGRPLDLLAALLARGRRRDADSGAVVARVARSGAATGWLMIDAWPREPAGMVVTLMDVSQPRMVESALREAEARYRSLIEQATDIIFEADARGDLTYVNRAATAVLGYGPGAPLPNAFDIIHPDDRERVRRAFAGAAGAPATVYEEFRVSARDGRTVWLGVQAERVVRQGAAVGYQAIARDITGRTRVEGELHEQDRLLRGIAQASTALLAGADDPAAVDRALAALGVAAGVDRVYVFENHSDPDTGALLLSQRFEWTVEGIEPQIGNPDLQNLPYEAGFQRWYATLSAGRPIRGHVRDFPPDERAVLEPQSIVSILVVPVRVDDTFWGFLGFDLCRGEREWTDGDAAMLTAVGTSLGHSIARRRALDALRRSEQRFRSLVQNSSDVTVVVDVRGRITYISPSVRRILGYDADGLVGSSVLANVHPDDLPRARALYDRRSLDHLPPGPVEFRVRHADGSWRPLEVITTNMVAEASVGGIVINARDISERKQAEEELIHRELHDALTGLPNRTLFNDRTAHALDRSRRVGTAVAVLLLDLDRFKVVNDSLGHAAGDELLIAVARRLLDCLRPGDTVARLGGDEFAVLIEDTDDPIESLHVAESILEVLRRPFALAGREVFVTACVGIAISTPADDRGDELVREANVALHQAKSEGTARTVVFDTEMNARAVQRLELETDLRQAIERGQLRLLYQPIVSLATDDLYGLEALVRWRHPSHGLLGPDEFIGLAEETGLIRQLGRWVLREACERGRALQHAWNRPLVISVNISPREFQDERLAEVVQGVLASTGLQPNHLRLEITESALMLDTDATISTLVALRSLGVQLAIDDFGTGYSSLSYLRRFPVDAVKVDRSFVRTMDSDAGAAAIVRAVAVMAHALGMTVTAEGIETAGQRGAALATGCDRGQGFLFARPLSPEDLTAYLDARRAPPARP
jgi:diguanylate cyclase (GGDEF)-like protein/PAS domain S-box-containing protein